MMKSALPFLAILMLGCVATEPNYEYYELNSELGWKPGIRPTDLKHYVSWKEAIDILLSDPGKVEATGQGHSLQVNIVFDDTSYIQTIEPDIDAIFMVLNKCGEPCEHILQVSE